jgi:hypothetical protein
VAILYTEFGVVCYIAIHNLRQAIVGTENVIAQCYYCYFFCAHAGVIRLK